MQAKEQVCPQPWEGLFRRLMGEWGTPRAVRSDRREKPLAPSVYTDGDRYHAEIANLFRRLPLCLGHVDQLGTTGNVLARKILDLPILVVRDSAGTVRVFLNACRHRGVRLLAEQELPCQRSSLSCQYHGWTYGLDGALVSVPRRDAFPTLDVAARGLRQLPSAVRHGLIWVVLDLASPQPPDVAGYLGPLDVDLAALDIGNHRFFRQSAVLSKANWKLIVDAFIEFYHIKRLHAATIGQFFADSMATADHVGQHQRMLVARDCFPETLNLSPDQWSPRVHGTLVHFVFPNSIIVYHPDYISHMGIFPAAVDQTLFVHTVLTPELPQTEGARAHWERSFDLVDGKVFNKEDLFICQEIQLGLAAAANETFLLGHLEDNVRRFHETIDVALAVTAEC
jgi:phenylpropionate dioxygenase-like ring-hydroxylating dioxygenase large terminal subunit